MAKPMMAEREWSRNVGTGNHPVTFLTASPKTHQPSKKSISSSMGCTSRTSIPTLSVCVPK